MTYAALIPAYVEPRAIVELVQGPGRPRLLVINPDNGPGPDARTSYGEVVRSAQEAGTRVLGYVATSYGARNVSGVFAHVDRYASWYGIDGIFFDEVPGGEAQLPYYETLARHVRSSGAGLVVLNPGVVPARGYFDVADVVVTFEGPFTVYREAARRMPAWIRKLGPGRVAHLVYGAPEDQALADPEDGDGAYVYMTPGSPPNPWQTLPACLRNHGEAARACS